MGLGLVALRIADQKAVATAVSYRVEKLSDQHYHDRPAQFVGTKDPGEDDVADQGTGLSDGNRNREFPGTTAICETAQVMLGEMGKGD